MAPGAALTMADMMQGNDLTQGEMDESVHFAAAVHGNRERTSRWSDQYKWGEKQSFITARNQTPIFLFFVYPEFSNSN